MPGILLGACRANYGAGGRDRIREGCEGHFQGGRQTGGFSLYRRRGNTDLELCESVRQFDKFCLENGPGIV